MSILLALGESMPGCWPKASKLVKMPNWNHDPRKPTLLGTILKNAAECESGIIACNDFVQNPEWKSRKKYSKEKLVFSTSQRFWHMKNNF